MKKTLFCVLLIFGGIVCVADDYIDDVYYTPSASTGNQNEIKTDDLRPTYPSNIKELEYVIVEDSTATTIQQDSIRKE